MAEKNAVIYDSVAKQFREIDTAGGETLAGVGGAANPADLVSSDAGNSMIVGADNKLYVPAAAGGVTLGDPTNDPLLKEIGGKLYSEVSLTYNPTGNVLEMRGVGGRVIASVTMSIDVRAIRTSSIVVNPAGHPPDTYLYMAIDLNNGTSADLYTSLSSLIDVYSGSMAIDVTGKVVSLRTAPGRGLNVDAQGAYVNTQDIVGVQTDNIIKRDGAGRLIVLPADVVAAVGGGGGGGGTANPNDLVSTQANNALVLGADGKLYVARAVTNPADLVSATAGNQLSVGYDGKLTVPAPTPVNPADLVSAQANNAITTSTDGKLYLNSTTLAGGVSADANNILVAGSDGKPYFPRDFGNI